MIARITGILVDLQADTALIEASPGIVHELLLPAFVTQRLAPSLSQTVTLHTDPEKVFTFEFDPTVKENLLKGLDDIALSLEHAGAIDAFESGHDTQISTAG